MEKLAPHGGCNWKGCKECFPAFAFARIPLKYEEIERGDWLIRMDDSLRGYVSAMVNFSAHIYIKTTDGALVFIGPEDFHLWLKGN